MAKAMDTEKHDQTCWMNALLDTAENLEGTEWDTYSNIVEVTADNLQSGGSTCLCGEYSEGSDKIDVHAAATFTGFIE